MLYVLSEILILLIVNKLFPLITEGKRSILLLVVSWLLLPVFFTDV